MRAEFTAGKRKSLASITCFLPYLDVGKDKQGGRGKK
jgi:hypothetical protein